MCRAVGELSVVQLNSEAARSHGESVSVPVPLYRRYRYRYRTPVPVLDLALALVEVLVQGKLYVKVFPEVGKAGKVGSTASTVFYMPDAVQNSWQYTDRLPNSKKSGDCAKPPKSLEFVPNRDSGLGKSLSS